MSHALRCSDPQKRESVPQNYLCGAGEHEACFSDTGALAQNVVLVVPAVDQLGGFVQVSRHSMRLDGGGGIAHDVGEVEQRLDEGLLFRLGEQRQIYTL